mmetsp:Transcript_9688/g.17637  ORF Transcript_9688/g.17637 Transcript_9688/m.17637 type:complete len:243 (-) Transcript_9688:166-894(-)
MASLLHCLLRSCFEEEGEQQERITYEPPNAARMVRSAAHYESTSQHAQHEDTDDDNDDDDCCRPSDDNDHGFWKSVRTRWRTRYESLEPVEGGAETTARVHSTVQNEAPTFQRSGIFRRSTGSGNNKKEPEPSLLSLSRSPLKAASSFRHSKGMPTIDADEVVLPGSALQQEMAKSMSLSLEEQGEECVICLENFDATNPKMPTLCGCGENKTYFHLPCLYQWIEQSRDCPSCRKRLRWEEF